MGMTIVRRMVPMECRVIGDETPPIPHCMLFTTHNAAAAFLLLLEEGAEITTPLCAF